MSAALSISSPPAARGAFTGLLALLAGLGRAIRFPFDAILAGMVTAGLCVERLCEILDLTPAGLYDHVVRLGLPSPSDKPARRRSVRGWSTADEQKALVWRAAGVHPEAIGANLSRPRKAAAVRAKMRRMGQARPSRKDLYRPDQAFFAAFSTGWASPFDTAAPSSPAGSCGRAAGPATHHSAQTTPATAAGVDAASVPVEPQPVVRPAPGSAVVAFDPAKRAIGSAAANLHDKGRRAADGQREFGFFSVVAGAESTDTVTARQQAPDAAHQSVADRPLPVLTPIPATCEEVHFNDLSWVASVKRPLTHMVAVYVMGMLVMAGVHYRVAARLTGKTAASYRTLRTRTGAPVDRDRTKFVQHFDLALANATRDRDDWVVAKSLSTADYHGPPLFFWKKKSDRNTHLSPVLRKRDELFARQSPTMTIVTRQMLEAERRLGLADKGAMQSFANAQGRMAGSAAAMA